MTAAVATAGVAMLISPHAYCSAAVISSRRSGFPARPAGCRAGNARRQKRGSAADGSIIDKRGRAGGSTGKHRERRRRSSEVSGRTRDAVAPFKYTSSGVSRGGRSPPPWRVGNRPKERERERRVPSLRRDESPLIPNTFSAAKLFRCQRRDLTPLADGAYIPYVTL